MDIIGQILWTLMFVTPLVTIPFVWKHSQQKKFIRILVGLAWAFVLSLILYWFILAIILRNGIGN